MDTNMKTVEFNEVLDVKELMQYLGISESKIRQLIHRRAIPFVKLDGQYRFFLPVVREWLVQSTVTTVDSSEADAQIARSADAIWEKAGGK
jgi:excisionase family DNA binding protein